LNAITNIVMNLICVTRSSIPKGKLNLFDTYRAKAKIGMIHPMK